MAAWLAMLVTRSLESPDGCGAKFKDGDAGIEGQKVGKEFNDDIATLKNTILKMAKKRAKIDAVIAVTRSSGIFTQKIWTKIQRRGITERVTKGGGGIA